MPYRIDLRAAGDRALDSLVDLGALDAEFHPDGSVAALIPDGIPPHDVARALGADAFSVAPARGRDADSVWVLSPRPIRVARLEIGPAHLEPVPGRLRLGDGAAFGSGWHPTTALCLHALDDALRIRVPEVVLDVGTGSGLLALGALMMGVPRAVGLDLDEEALRAAAANARLNALDQRLRLVRGGAEAVAGRWPLIVANVLAAPLIEMAPVLVRGLGRHARLVLSGIPASLAQEVEQAYRRLGLRRVRVTSRAGWVALVLDAPW